MKFNIGELIDALDGDSGIAFEMLDVYLSSHQKLVENVKSCAKRQDGAALPKAIHALKGALSLFGLKSICNELKALEIKIRENIESVSSQEIEATIDKINEVYISMIETQRKERAS